ncbi:hypothetical protein KXW75_002745 [Aspergillus fumigatus]|uniref:cyclic pyranopterin monophosphate synthase n=2 Tax=Aspergillus fumigatus TaxID=746128 RepID=Q4WRG7_ASPFU|nr:molybdenum cofactor biosynthesis protein (MoaC), putative [Aspergillus fumigatus Af293]EDP56850.1 molybdenum cofactor biosynthesis protein (MoaC), putative [Aspergillus fumigatus A1163]KAH1319064.1 hypothetical protein KXX47_002167 [Aspergillus fumigatus]EAL90965.1 molybdenum cofactor biosynthesis protein (MoaC), putative [Aspergillus fumigatus Af293]KAH1391104.1 hypothetical protein KXX10_004992 [Aspergillus fumigatus]KAH1405697.1 hypothetical protein KXX22_001359 [Aspergillus fumigatus]
MLIEGLDSEYHRNTTSANIPLHLLPLHTSPFKLQARHYHKRSNNSAPDSRPEHKPEPAPAAPAAPSSPSPSLPTTSDPDLPHLTPSQTVHMTQITEKPITARSATASCLVHFSNARPHELLRKGLTKKGDVFSVARIAGIMAAKKTPDLIPLCHPSIGITGVEVDVTLVDPAPLPGPGSLPGSQASSGTRMRYGAMRVVATVSCAGRTGVEMEAMTATVGAALTVYDMLKAVDKGMVIGDVQLLEKKGGKSGHWVRDEQVKEDP